MSQSDFGPGAPQNHFCTHAHLYQKPILCAPCIQFLFCAPHSRHICAILPHHAVISLPSVTCTLRDILDGHQGNTLVDNGSLL